jgi:nucleolar protein 14
MQRRNKVGGIIDRRFGEDDPTMAPEDRMMQRFVREQQKHKGHSVFDLEEAEDEEELTHAGKALNFEKEAKTQDDFEGESIASSSEDDGGLLRKRKRDTTIAQESEPEGIEEPERKKSKAEIMKEVIAKSKLHKHERQKAKEEDVEQMEELDNDFGDIMASLRGHKPQIRETLPSKQPNGPTINPERAALINGAAADMSFDAQVRELKQDRRAQPTERTKTDEEKARDEAERLKMLEENRLRRERGEPEEEEDDDEEDDDNENEEHKLEDSSSVRDGLLDDAQMFGLSRKLISKRPVGVDDEDDFLIDEDLVASGSDIDEEFSESDFGSESNDHSQQSENEEEDGFISVLANDIANDTKETDTSSSLPFTYPCPRSHAELLKVLQDVTEKDVPKVIQRIRALHDPKLQAGNKEKLADFAVALVEHVHYISKQKPAPSPVLIETLARHIHSLSLRHFGMEIAIAFRSQLQHMQSTEFATAAHLAVLTCIGSIYPTSDYFHSVITPASTIIGRWLGLKAPSTVEELTLGAYLCAISLHYQRLSKRYAPELIRFVSSALSSPITTPDLISTYMQILTTAMNLWSDQSAFIEIFSYAPLLKALECHKDKHSHTFQRLQILLSQSQMSRRPLELHHHRPLPIKTQIPRFEESYQPGRHYDPKRDRAELAKLKAEYRKERKGAMRELRKDANFIARTKLREKKEADRAYEEKMRRLVGTIQGEEGREKNEYERIKRARKGKM